MTQKHLKKRGFFLLRSNKTKPQVFTHWPDKHKEVWQSPVLMGQRGAHSGQHEDPGELQKEHFLWSPVRMRDFIPSSSRMVTKHYQDLVSVLPALSNHRSLQTLASCTQTTGMEEERSFQTNNIECYQSWTQCLAHSRLHMILWGELFLFSVLLRFLHFFVFSKILHLGMYFKRFTYSNKNVEERKA